MSPGRHALHPGPVGAYRLGERLREARWPAWLRNPMVMAAIALLIGGGIVTWTMARQQQQTQELVDATLQTCQLGGTDPRLCHKAEQVRSESVVTPPRVTETVTVRAPAPPPATRTQIIPAPPPPAVTLTPPAPAPVTRTVTNTETVRPPVRTRTVVEQAPPVTATLTETSTATATTTVTTTAATTATVTQTVTATETAPASTPESSSPAAPPPLVPLPN